MVHILGLRAIAVGDLGDDLFRIRHFEIHLARRRIGRPPRRQKLRQALPGPPHQFGDQKPWDHARIAAHEIAEIVMRRHLAAIDRAMRAHRGLQIGMSRRGHHRPPPSPRHHILSVPDHPWVMHNGRPRLFGQKHLGQKAHDIFPRHKGSGFVKEKTAVEIAVPSNAQIGPMRAHGLGRHRLVFGQKRVWDAIGETAIRRVVQPNELQRRARRRQCSRQGVKRRPRRAVAGIDHHPQGS